MSGFGTALKEWRRLRGLSQLDLAARSEVSQRHISFIETGRSIPSKEMVIHLGTVLEVPLREQNLLLTAAGHAPSFSETPLDHMDGISDALDFMLQAHMPHMAIVVDRQWNVLSANTAATTFTARLLGASPLIGNQPLNVMRLNFHPEGLRPHMAAWEDTASALLRRLRRDVITYPHDQTLHDLLAEIESYPDVNQLPPQASAVAPQDLLVAATYLLDGQELSLFTTIAIIGDAHDLTAAELRLETFWPVDQPSAQLWKQLTDTG